MTTDAKTITRADSLARVRRRTRSRSWLEPYLLLAPAVALVTLFAAVPLLRSLWFSLNEISPFTGQADFVGLRNFARILGDEGIGGYLGITVAWVLGAVALQLALGLVMALLLNTRFPLRGVYRGLAMVPWATPSVLVALMWKWILDPNDGVANQALLSAGLVDRPVEFLSSSATALPTLVLIDVWQGVPLFAVMILAALQSVPQELRDSAAVDGCNRWQAFRSVVVPVILPTVLITVVLRLIWTANYVDLIYILTGGGPGEASTTVALQSYLTAYRATNFGQGAAYAVLQALVLSVLVIVYVRLTNRKETR
jgi:multiple sugar transport system permease protein